MFLHACSAECLCVRNRCVPSTRPYVVRIINLSMEDPQDVSALLNAYGPGLLDLLSFGGDDGWDGFGLSSSELEAARAFQPGPTAFTQEDGWQLASTSQPAAPARHKRARSSALEPCSKRDGVASARNPKALQAEFGAKVAQISHLKEANKMLEERCKLLEYVRQGVHLVMWAHVHCNHGLPPPVGCTCARCMEEGCMGVFSTHA